MNPPAVRRLALTPGEPAGVGPELCVRIAQQAWPVELVAYADPGLLRTAAERLGLPLELVAHEPSRAPVPQAPGTLGIAPLALATLAEPGRLDPANAG